MHLIFAMGNQFKCIITVPFYDIPSTLLFDTATLILNISYFHEINLFEMCCDTSCLIYRDYIWYNDYSYSSSGV